MSKQLPRGWTRSDSKDLYAIEHWGQGMLSVGNTGDLVLHPFSHHDASGKRGPGLSLKSLVDDLVKRGINPPLLLRFPDLLEGRISAIANAFRDAIEEFDYAGDHRGVYPIKVNQDHVVVERIAACGKPFHYGLEAGSKPELLAAMALIDDEDALLICNGYKDEHYVETALYASKLGRRVIMVVEKPTELELIARVSKRLEIEPRIGIRAKLSARGTGHWKESGGDRSKFGLSAAELLDAVRFLRDRDMLGSFQLLHFHLGSQISSIRPIKNALREATRLYVELVRLGASLRYVDVGGGLGVDYDGSQTSFHSSMNYTLQEYANDVVYNVGEICKEAGVPQPTLVTEAGRAITAHHAVLVLDVLGVTKVAPKQTPTAPADDVDPVLRRMWETYDELTRKNMIESYHDAVQFKEEALQLFNLGHLSLDQRVSAETIFWSLCQRIYGFIRGRPDLPEELEGLEAALADTYFCNFSVFQSLPDTWAVNQLFPVVPIHRLNERPTRRGILADITCDSDGKIAKFIDLKDVKDVLELHTIRRGEPYYLAFFLVGAYQEILGDLHNLFGDTNEVHVSADETGAYRIDGVEPGETVTDVLRYVGYDRNRLVALVRNAAENALRAERLTLEESRQLIRSYEKGLAGTTYLEQF